MNDKRIYTPDGVQDILTDECRLKRDIEEKVRKRLRQSGFLEIETPSIEYYDVFAAGGVIEQEMMYKFSDASGALLALRPDMTVPAMRVFSAKMKDRQLPVKLFYIGNVFRYNEAGGGRYREFTQAGTEMIGAPGPLADAEVIAQSIGIMKELGIDDFQVDIGQVEFFKGIVAAEGVDEETVETVRQCIDRKDYAQLEMLLKGKSFSKELADKLLGLPGLFGTADVLDKAEKFANNERSAKAIDNLREVIKILEDYGLGDSITVDLGMLGSLNYYTGTIFKGFTKGSGFPVMSGGRYDGLSKNYGRDSSATGFSIGLNMVMRVLERKDPSILKEKEPITRVCFDKENRSEAFALVEKLRSQGIRAESDTEGLTAAQAKARENELVKYIFAGETSAPKAQKARKERDLK